MSEERCVCCGEIIPEGRQVCINCSMKRKGKDMNKGFYTGRFTSDVELKQTPNGVSVCSFTLAVERPNAKETTDFINFVAWRGTAEFICKYFKKGQKILVVGQLQSRKYKDSNGKNRVAFEVVVDSAEFCESKKKDESAPVDEETQQQKFEELKPDEDLPF